MSDVTDVPGLVPARMPDEFTSLKRLFFLGWVDAQFVDDELRRSGSAGCGTDFIMPAGGVAFIQFVNRAVLATYERRGDSSSPSGCPSTRSPTQGPRGARAPPHGATAGRNPRVHTCGDKMSDWENSRGLRLHNVYDIVGSHDELLQYPTFFSGPASMEKNGLLGALRNAMIRSENSRLHRSRPRRSS